MSQHRPGSFLAAAVALTALAVPALADNPHALGSSFPICDLPGGQASPWIISDGANGAIVGWTNNSPAGVEIRAQHLNPSGNRQWPVEGIRVGRSGNIEDWSSAIPDGNGGAFVAWERSSNNAGNFIDVYAQHVDSRGQVLWGSEGVPLCTAPGIQSGPQLASDGKGGVIATWTFDRREGSISSRAHAQHLDGQGAPLWAVDGIPISSVDSGQIAAGPVSDGAGGAIFAWTDDRNGLDIYAQRLNGDGAPLWAADGVPVCIEPAPEGYCLLTADGAGGAVVIWQDGRGMDAFGYGWHLYAQHLRSDGSASWAENGVPIVTTAGDKVVTGFIGDGAGGAILSWAEPKFEGNRFLVQRIGVDGTPVWPGSGVLVAIGHGVAASLASDNAHGALVAWGDQGPEGDNSLHAQHVGSDGSMMWGSAGVTLAPGALVLRGTPEILANGGGALVCWQDTGSDPEADIVGQRVLPSGKLPGPSAPSLSIASALTISTASSSTIRFELTNGSEIALQIYDASGRKVRALPAQFFPAGENHITLPKTGDSGARLRDGVYFFKLEGGSLARSGRFVVLH